MKVNKNVDFKKEAIDILYKINLSKDVDSEFINELYKSDVPEKILNKEIAGYLNLKEFFKNEIVVPEKLRPYFSLEFNNTSILKRLYVKYNNSNIIDYPTFLNRFFEVDLLLKDDYSKTLGFNDILNIVNKLEVSDKDKLVLINFYIGKETLFQEIIEFVEMAAKVVEKYYYLVENQVNELYNSIVKEEVIEEFYKDYFDGKELYNDQSEVTISICEYNYIYHMSINNKHHIYLGFLALQLDSIIKKYKNVEEDTLNAIKSISDPTRYKIIKILGKRKTYGNDIANILGLSAATINHHLNILVNLQLIKLSFDEADNKKIYYELNKDKLNEILETFWRNLM